MTTRRSEAPPPPSAGVRIGELSRRVGVSEHVLRAWEHRYGVLRPGRTAGGFRLYTAADEARVRRMRMHLDRGLSAAEAARAAIEEPPTPIHRSVAVPGSAVDELAAALRTALDEFDEAGAHRSLDSVLSELSLPTALREVVLPYLRELGERWEAGQISIAQEHFASNLVRGRLAALAHGRGDDRGPRAVVACPPGELHDLPTLMFSVMLRRAGWRVNDLGANTPIEELLTVVRRQVPAVVVLAATTEERFRTVEPALRELAAVAPLAIGGAGATASFAEALGARLLEGDPVSAAESEAAAAA